jgi:acyl dehydratase
VDARWLMAYSAALGETDPRYFDTAARGGVIAHPLFPVCYEWPVSQPIRQIPELREHFPWLVHAEHDLVLHRPVRQADTLSTVARIVSVESRKPGAYVVFRFDARDAAGEPVSSTDFGVLYRGVGVAGASRRSEDALPPLEEAAAPLEAAGRLAIAANAAHVYTECARIWNPIHTDLAHARKAGLPGIILHGTATLALSLSRALAACGAEASQVRRVRCRFSGMVLMPSTLSVHAGRSGRNIAFETRDERGEAVIRGGVLVLAA